MFVGEIKEYFRVCYHPMIPCNVQTILWHINFSKYLPFGYINPQMCYIVILALLSAS